MTKYVEKFESDIKNTFMDVNGRSLTEVRCDPVKATQKKTFRDESSASKLKDENEQGFEEQVKTPPALTCFADTLPGKTG